MGIIHQVRRNQVVREGSIGVRVLYSRTYCSESDGSLLSEMIAVQSCSA